MGLQNLYTLQDGVGKDCNHGQVPQRGHIIPVLT